MLKKINKFFRLDGGFTKIIELLLDSLVILIGLWIAVLLLRDFSGKGDIYIIFTRMISKVLESITAGDFFPFTGTNTLLLVGLSTLSYVIICVIMLRVYETTLIKRRYLSSVFATFIALFITNVFFVIIKYIFPVTFPYFSTVVFLLAAFMQLVACFIVKFPLWFVLKKWMKRPTIVISPRADAASIVNKIISDQNTRDKINYIYFQENVEVNDNLINYIDQCKTVYISSEYSTKVKNKLISYCIAKKDIQIKLIPKLYEIGLFKSQTTNIDDKLMFKMRPLELSIEQRFIKRTFDIIISLLGLILSIPIFIVIFILIKLDDRGNFLYSQDRVTRNGRVFKIYKIRTMSTNQQLDEGAINQITGVGKFIRALRFNNIPQLWNVLIGEMSLVGPRPMVQSDIDEFKKLDANFMYRTNVKAGLIGFARYSSHESIAFKDSLRLDLLYIRNQSFLFDMKIILSALLLFFVTKAPSTWNDSKSFEDLLKEKKIKVRDIEDNIIKFL